MVGQSTERTTANHITPPPPGLSITPSLFFPLLRQTEQGLRGRRVDRFSHRGAFSYGGHVLDRAVSSGAFSCHVALHAQAVRVLRCVQLKLNHSRPGRPREGAKLFHAAGAPLLHRCYSSPALEPRRLARRPNLSVPRALGARFASLGPRWDAGDLAWTLRTNIPTYLALPGPTWPYRVPAILMLNLTAFGALRQTPPNTLSLRIAKETHHLAGLCSAPGHSEGPSNKGPK